MWWRDRRPTLCPPRRSGRWRWRWRGLARRLLPAALRRPKTLVPAARPAPAGCSSRRGRRRSPRRTARRMARVAVEVRNDADLRPHRRRPAQPAKPTSSTIQLRRDTQQVIVDITTARPDVAELRHQRHLHADRDRHRQGGGDRRRRSRASPTTSPASSSASPARAACATPRTAPPRSSRKTSAIAAGVVFRRRRVARSDNDAYNGRRQSRRRRSLRRAARSGARRSCWSTGPTPAWCASAPKS